MSERKPATLENLCILMGLLDLDQISLSEIDKPRLKRSENIGAYMPTRRRVRIGNPIFFREERKVVTDMSKYYKDPDEFSEDDVEEFEVDGKKHTFDPRKVAESANKPKKRDLKDSEIRVLYGILRKRYKKKLLEDLIDSEMDKYNE